MRFDVRKEASLPVTSKVNPSHFSFFDFEPIIYSITKRYFSQTRRNWPRKRKAQGIPHDTTDKMKVFSPTLCLVAAATFVAKADEVAILEDTPEARLIKDHDPIAEATYHESDPVVQDSVGSDNLPRLVRNRGPLTKKVVASGSHFPGLDFSL